MKLAHIAAAVCLMTAGLEVPPAQATTPQVCRQPVEGYETYTDCYGMELTGSMLRAARAREMASMKRPAKEIADELGVQLLTVRAMQPACPRGATYVESERAADGQGFIVHCIN